MARTRAEVFQCLADLIAADCTAEEIAAAIDESFDESVTLVNADGVFSVTFVDDDGTTATEAISLIDNGDETATLTIGGATCIINKAAHVPSAFSSVTADDGTITITHDNGVDDPVDVVIPPSAGGDDKYHAYVDIPADWDGQSDLTGPNGETIPAADVPTGAGPGSVIGVDFDATSGVVAVECIPQLECLELPDSAFADLCAPSDVLGAEAEAWITANGTPGNVYENEATGGSFLYGKSGICCLNTPGTITECGWERVSGASGTLINDLAGDQIDPWVNVATLPVTAACPFGGSVWESVHMGVTTRVTIKGIEGPVNPVSVPISGRHQLRIPSGSNTFHISMEEVAVEPLLPAQGCDEVGFTFTRLQDMDGGSFFVGDSWSGTREGCQLFEGPQSATGSSPSGSANAAVDAWPLIESGPGADSSVSVLQTGDVGSVSFSGTVEVVGPGDVLAFQTYHQRYEPRVIHRSPKTGDVVCIVNGDGDPAIVTHTESDCL